MVRKNRLEWSVFAVSGVVLLFVFGYLGYHALTTEDDPADVDIELGTPQPQDGTFILPLTIHNRGGQSVEDVVRSASDFARRQPAIVFGFAALAGFMMFRTMQAASHHDNMSERSHGMSERNDGMSDRNIGGPGAHIS